MPTEDVADMELFSCRETKISGVPPQLISVSYRRTSQPRSFEGALNFAVFGEWSPLSTGKSSALMYRYVVGSYATVASVEILENGCFPTDSDALL